LAALSVVSTDAGRLQLNTNTNDHCDDLQNLFHTRVEYIHELQEAHPDASSMSATTHARFTMRTFGVVRILRRARDCPWVTDGDEDEMNEVRSVAHSALAGNPCGDAAMEALSAHPSPDNELQPLQDAVQILLSDNCEVSGNTAQYEIVDLQDETQLSQQLIDEEEMMQDHIEEIIDEAAAENESGNAGAFVQTEGLIRSVSRTLGVVFLSILYMLSCAAAAAVIGGLILFVVAAIPCTMMVPGPSALGCLLWPFSGAALGGAAGLVSCGIDAAHARGNFSQLGRGNF